MNRWVKGFFILIAVALLLLTSACGAINTGREQATPTPLPLPAESTKPTYTVSRGDIVDQVQFSARVVPSIMEELFFRSDGRVRKIYARPGSSVTKGQVLADLLLLDEMEAQKKQADFNLRRAEIALELALLRQQAVASQTSAWSPNYEIGLRTQELEVELAQIALDETMLKNQNLDSGIENAQIISPINGKILTMSLVEGAEIRAYTSAMVVGDDSVLEIGATLISTQMMELAEGMPAEIELLSLPGEKLKGVLRSLPYPYGTNGGDQAQTQSTSTMNGADAIARIAVTDPAQLKTFRLGDMVNVTIIIQRKTNVLWLPPAAVRSYEGRNFVLIKTDGLPRRVNVKVGIQNEEKVEILEGLEEGQIVIAP